MRTWLYIDGFNFYYGIEKPKKLPIGFAWCDFRKLGERFFICDGDVLERIRYFTSPVSRTYAIKTGEDIRQEIWLRAVRTIPGLDITEGKHVRPPGANRREKMTDVNIAVELLLDGFDEDRYEKALILSGDLDIWPAAIAIATRLPKPKVVEFWIPPDTPHGLLRDHCDWFGLPCSSVTPDMLYQSRFREEFEHEGQKITCHPKWRLSKEDKKRYAR